MFNAGDHVPVIGVVFVELVGKALKLPPEHIALTAVKVGVTFASPDPIVNDGVETAEQLG